MPEVSTLDTLNRRQRDAAQFGSGPLLIIAGAGTGKTNTLAHRVAHLVLSGARPERILLLTFTRRAALEMIRRTQRIVGAAMTGLKPCATGETPAITGLKPCATGEPTAATSSPVAQGTTSVAQGFSPVRLPWSGTFHSIANRLIRRHAAAVGLDAASACSTAAMPRT